MRRFWIVLLAMVPLSSHAALFEIDWILESGSPFEGSYDHPGVFDPVWNKGPDFTARLSVYDLPNEPRRDRDALVYDNVVADLVVDFGEFQLTSTGRGEMGYVDLSDLYDIFWINIAMSPVAGLTDIRFFIHTEIRPDGTDLLTGNFLGYLTTYSLTAQDENGNAAVHFVNGSGGSFPVVDVPAPSSLTLIVATLALLGLSKARKWRSSVSLRTIRSIPFIALLATLPIGAAQSTPIVIEIGMPNSIGSIGVPGHYDAYDPTGAFAPAIAAAEAGSEWSAKIVINELREPALLNGDEVTYEGVDALLSLDFGAYQLSGTSAKIVYYDYDIGIEHGALYDYLSLSFDLGPALGFSNLRYSFSAEISPLGTGLHDAELRGGMNTQWMLWANDDLGGYAMQVHATGAPMRGVVVPEPGSGVLFALGLLGAIGARRRYQSGNRDSVENATLST